ncbi:MAG: hypothetical protein AABW59_02990 [archaeon]
MQKATLKTTWILIALFIAMALILGCTTGVKTIPSVPAEPLIPGSLCSNSDYSTERPYSDAPIRLTDASIEKLKEEVASKKDAALFGISDLTCLGVLDLSWYDFDNKSLTDLSALSKLTNLEELNISYHPVSDISMLKGLTKLKMLDITSTNITDLKQLSIFPALDRLTMITPNTPMDLSPIANISSLKSVFLDTAQFSGTKEMQYLKDIEDITLNGDITSEQISYMKDFPKLKRVGLFKLKDYLPIASLKNIDALVLFDLDKEANLDGLKELTQLKDLRLGGAYDTGDNSLTSIKQISSLSNLEDLSLDEFESLDWKEASAAINDLNKLKSINMYNAKLTQVDFNPPALETLSIDDGQGVLKDISGVENMKSLKNLYIYSASPAAVSQCNDFAAKHPDIRHTCKAR